jgi:hypothetical protein
MLACQNAVPEPETDCNRAGVLSGRERRLIMAEQTTNGHGTEETSEHRSAAENSNGRGSVAANRTDMPRDSAAAKAVVTPPLASAILGQTSTPVGAADDEDDERVSNRKLEELGRKWLAAKKKQRRKSKERSAKEKAKGIRSVTLKVHTADRSLVMTFSKALITTLGEMQELNLDRAPLVERLTEVLRDYYRAEVLPKKAKS